MKNKLAQWVYSDTKTGEILGKSKPCRISEIASNRDASQYYNIWKLHSKRKVTMELILIDRE